MPKTDKEVFRIKPLELLRVLFLGVVLFIGAVILGTAFKEALKALFQ